jgi:acyl-CoA thioesterase-2
MTAVAAADGADAASADAAAAAEAAALADLLDAFALRQVAGGWVGRSTQPNLPRLFGGHVAAQALLAAGRTVAPDRPVHSVHCYFLRAGGPEVDTRYTVSHLLHGRSTDVRSVQAAQGEAVLLDARVSFRRPGTGPEHDAGPAPALVPAGDQRWQSWSAGAADLPSWWTRPLPLEIRFPEPPVALLGGGERRLPARFDVWMRPASAQASVEVTPALLAYASDLTMLDAALLPHGLAWYGTHSVPGASLDHSVWFHRSFAWRGWLRFHFESTAASGGRAFVRGTVTTPDGEVVASLAQEGVLFGARSRFADVAPV